MHKIGAPVLGALCFLSLTVLVASTASCGRQQPVSQESEAADQVEEVATESVPTGREAAVPVTTVGQESLTLREMQAAGKPSELGPLRVRLRGLFDLESRGWVPEPGMKLALVTIAFQSSEELQFNNGGFRVLSTDGTEYGPPQLMADPEAGASIMPAVLMALKPGQEESLNLVFEVPSDCDPTTFRLTYSQDLADEFRMEMVQSFRNSMR